MKFSTKLLSAICLMAFVSACTSSSSEPGDNIGSGRDERSISPCACNDLKLKGNEGLEDYKKALRKELTL